MQQRNTVAHVLDFFCLFLLVVMTFYRGNFCLLDSFKLLVTKKIATCGIRQFFMQIIHLE